MILALTGFLFYSYTDQPYYHSGFSVTLKPDGFHVLRVVEQSPAGAAGLLPGMVITTFDGLDLPDLFLLSDENLSRFLRVSAHLFRGDHDYVLNIEDFGERRFRSDVLPWRMRLNLLEPEVLLNFVVGVLFLLAGTWLMAVRKGDSIVGWFFVFSLAVAVAIPLSHFISYWSTSFLVLRFVLLDAAGFTAGCALAGFAYRFPDGPPLTRHGRRLVMAVPLLFVTKYLLILIGAVDPLGAVIFAVHGVVGVSLLVSIFLVTQRYRATDAGGRRQIRWTVAGMIVSLVPFLVFLLVLLMQDSILDEGAAVFSRMASLGILGFPVFVGIGVVRYNLFDIDRFLSRFAIILAIALVGTGFFSLLFFYFVDTTINIELYLLFLAVTVLSPALYLQLDRGADRIMRRWRRERGFKDAGQILLEMEQELIGVFRKEDVYAIVTSSLIQAFEPTRIAFISRLDEGEQVHFSYPKDSSQRQERRKDSEEREFTLFHTENSTMILQIGAKRDEDIYTRQDLHLLSGTAAQISKTLMNCDLHDQLQESVASTELAQRTTILALAKLTEYRDNETGRHLDRIQEYTRLLSRAIRHRSSQYQFLTDEIIEEFCRSSVLHDIGKVGVPDSILLKPGHLTREEFEIIKQHPVIGGQVIEDAEALHPERSFLSIAKAVAFQHHERWDGTGYPYGLSGDDIALPARIVAVVDVYDALRSVRPYKDAMSHEAALEIIRDGAGKHFDPDLVEAFCAIESQIAAVER